MPSDWACHPCEMWRMLKTQFTNCVSAPATSRLLAGGIPWRCYSSVLSAVCIANRYGMEGPGIEYRWDKISCTSPNRYRSPPNHLYNGYRVSFPGVKRPGRGVEHPTQSSAKVKERVELYLSSPSAPSWSAVGWPFPYKRTAFGINKKWNLNFV